jgi:hypothetical protein
MELSCLILSLATDIEPQSQRSPLAAQIIDLGYASESRGSSPPAVPGSFPVPTIRVQRETSLLADDGDSAPSTPQDLGDSTLRGLGHAAEYFVVFAIPELRNLSPSPRDILLAISKFRRSPSNVWPSLSKFAHVERDRLLTAVVVT